jgi:stage V sporulation protein AD
MAPSAADTLLRYFYESGNSPDSFDIILTGDLGAVGADIFCNLVKQAGITFGKGKYNDCGMMIYDLEKQSKYSGGSGCGCSAVVCASWLIPRIISGEIRHALFMSTGAMMSPSSIQQGLAIPAIAHLVHFQYDQNGD